MTFAAQRIIVRQGMSQEIPTMPVAEMGWDIDLRRLRVGDGSPSPVIIMSNKSLGPFEYNFIQYVQFPEIRMLPDGTVDGVDISDLNAKNGYVVRRGDNLWGHRTFKNVDGHIEYVFPDGVAGDTIINFSASFNAEILTFLKVVAVDDITIHGDGRSFNPLFAQQATFTQAGVIRIATQGEVFAGSSTTTAVCPAYLQAWVIQYVDSVLPDDPGGGGGGGGGGSTTINNFNFGAIIKGGKIQDLAGNSGTVNLAGKKYAVLYVQVLTPTSDDNVCMQFGSITIGHKQPGNNVEIPVVNASTGSTQNFAGSQLLSLFRTPNGVWVLCYNGVGYGVGGDVIAYNNVAKGAGASGAIYDGSFAAGSP